LISIDRDISIEKAKGIAEYTGINQIIIGKDIITQLNQISNLKSESDRFEFMQKHINTYRKILRSKKITNEIQDLAS